MGPTMSSGCAIYPREIPLSIFARISGLLWGTAVSGVFDIAWAYTVQRTPYGAQRAAIALVSIFTPPFAVQ